MNNRPTLDMEVLDTIRATGGAELLSQVVGLFRQSAPRVLKEIEMAIQGGDAETLERSAHRLKGSCLVLGATGAASICRSLEMKAHDGILEGAESQISALGHALEKVMQALHALASAGNTRR